MQRIEQIRKEARNIQMALECMNNPNIEAMIERLDQLGVYYARSGELLSEVVGMRWPGCFTMKKKRLSVCLHRWRQNW